MDKWEAHEGKFQISISGRKTLTSKLPNISQSSMKSEESKLSSSTWKVLIIFMESSNNFHEEMKIALNITYHDNKFKIEFLSSM